MIVGSIKEDISLEKRVSLTPETAKKYNWTWITNMYRKNYVNHLGISDNEYKNNGVEIKNSSNDIFKTK